MGRSNVSVISKAYLVVVLGTILYPSKKNLRYGDGPSMTQHSRFKTIWEGQPEGLFKRTGCERRKFMVGTLQQCCSPRRE